MKNYFGREDSCIPSLKKRLWLYAVDLANEHSPSLMTRIFHYRRTRKWPSLTKPKDFNEKLQWLKLNEAQNLKAHCSDKYMVREYVAERCGESVLNNIIAVYDRPEDLVWSDLPEKFALKCTHGCGYNIIVQAKEELDECDVRSRLDSWLEERYGRLALEYHYDLINPRVLVEEYIENSKGFLPLDYKIYCFNGEPKLVLVCSGRDESLKLDFFDLSWKKLEIGLKENESSEVLDPPDCIDEMIAYARLLSQPFSFVRVDFYDKDGVPIFGELTFTPAGNVANYYSDYGLEYLGGLLDLPKAT